MPFSDSFSATFSLELGDEVSEAKEVARMPWRVLKRLNAVDGFVELYANGNADNESRMWSCDAAVDFRILCPKNKVLVSKNTGLSYFKANGSHLWGFKRFISVDALKEHFSDGRFRVETTITVQRMSGLRLPPVFAFDQSAHSDCALVVDGEKLWINRSYLALYSPYFESLFFGDFAEAKTDSIEIRDVSRDEFVEFLQVIYPSHNEVTEENVESLLRLGDRFEVAFVTECCEDFLLATERFSFAEKLLISGQYRLCRLESRICASRRSTRSPISGASPNLRKRRSSPTSRKPTAAQYKVPNSPSFVF
ncbi:hypothetical protein QR680_009111 [Steinernema hermaphroditum]|uniref:BTB domain-containing protein n=1 Tax=Steinernema hermaphroditum TaxID=289476 RepID=A0AA39ILF4_9BILA|nr:hypothetical protein QR680_009111 [Steinernema hermaphroditum]